MQLFSADTAIFKIKINIFLLMKTKQNKILKSSILYSPTFFQYCQLAQNQPKSHILFDKNGSLRDFYKMTLPADLVITANIIIEIGTQDK